MGATEFLGYGTDVAEARIEAIVRDGAEVASAATGDEVTIVVNQTPFYGESGGQVGDTGVMFSAHGGEVAVSQTSRKLIDLFDHVGVVTHGSLHLGDVLELRVEGDNRAALRANHSATHLLHAALRNALGDHVTQKGSLVAPDRLRFDVSHFKAMTPEELTAVEIEVNAEVRRNSPVETVLMSPDEAVEKGALALFGEKYGDEVRVVSMGVGGEGAAPFSVELCGGTHVRRSGSRSPGGSLPQLPALDGRL